jgi:hypothetical protein
MWDCETCGCQAIAGTLTECPVCRTPRPEVVPAESSGPDASAATDAAVAVRETPQAPGNEDGDWGLSDGKSN